MTTSHRSPRSRLALISLSVLGLALATSAPCWASTAQKSAKATTAKTTTSKASTPPLRVKLTVDAPVTKAKSGAKTTVKTTTVKTTTVKTGTKSAKIAAAATKATSKSGKIVKVAVVTTKKSSKKTAPAPKPIVLASVAMPPVEQPVVMNATPVPYGLMAAQPATKINAVALTNPLSPYDVELYQAAFDLIDSGDFNDAEAKLAQVSDKSLMGYAEFHKLFNLKYTATYDELVGWLDTYGDQPMAMRVWGLAKRKKPDGAPDPAFPSLNGLSGAQAASIANSGGAVQLAAYTTLSDNAPQRVVNAGPSIDSGDSDLTPKSARSAYNNGQLEQAVSLGRKIGDHWVTGLALWRLKRFDQAETEFKFVSTDPSRNAWSQSSGAYWAGRCAMKLGQKDDADTFFKIAASFPFTFYGLVAEQRLGVTPAVTLAKKGQAPTYSNESRNALTASLDSDFAWTKGNVKATRLNALVQIGRNSDAQNELQSAIQTAGDGNERDSWLAVSAKTRIPVSQLKPADRLFDPAGYPIPDFVPKGGFTVDKALMYAFARKESKFNAGAHSYAGAYGLLQLMPATAAIVEGDNSFNSQPNQLLQPAVNLRVGQHYILKLQASGIVSNDLLRTIAAYNAGPRPVKDALDSLGGDTDSLLVMESIPVAQTRQYVEEVAASYWIYRQLMDQPSPSLAQAAADARIIDATAD